jgi:hypothetical protein
MYTTKITLGNGAYGYLSLGAWPFLVVGMICLINSVIEREPRLLNNSANVFFIGIEFLRGTFDD